MTTPTPTRRPGRPRSGASCRSTAETRSILERLEHVKEQLDYWREERNQFIAAAYYAGVSTDRIRRTAGVEESTVYAIARAHKREQA